jgi:phage baseplate assembly protein gpV
MMIFQAAKQPAPSAINDRKFMRITDGSLTLYKWDGDTLTYETSWEKRPTTHDV